MATAQVAGESEVCTASCLDGTIIHQSIACPQEPRSLIAPVSTFMSKNFFVLGMLGSIALAWAEPRFGLKGGPLRPELTIDAFGVSAIFLLSGLGLPVSDLVSAAANWKLNIVIQTLNLGVTPFIVLALVAALKRIPFTSTVLHPSLLDGLTAVVCPRLLTHSHSAPTVPLAHLNTLRALLALRAQSCLPTTVNQNVVLTQSAGGNVASALFNAVAGNLIGIVISPLLIFRLLGAQHISIPFLKVLRKLTMKVVVPVALGQVLRLTPLKELRQRNKQVFSRASEILLLGIIYTTFCDTFHKGMGVAFKQISGLFVLLPLMHLFFCGLVLGVARWPRLNFRREDQVAAMFCASHKTIAFGMPLLKEIFDGNPSLALLTAPILILHPLQLIIGSFLMPSLRRYIKEEESLQN